MSDEFLYLETIGRTTGRQREIEIWFVAHQGRHYVVSGNREASGWVRNIAANPAVHFSVGSGEAREARLSRTAAMARALDPAIDQERVATVSALMDAKYKWSNGLIVELTPVAQST